MDRPSGREVDRLVPELYGELRRLAERAMRGERADHTLQPTALVHEAYLYLAGSASLEVRSRAELLALAARVMRHVLVDHARARRSAKRGGGALRVTLSAGMLEETPTSVDLIALDETLERLGRVDEDQVRIVELRFIAGLSVEETAEALGVSASTVKRETALARAWLYRELRGAGGGGCR